MIVGIVGSEEAKFTANGRFLARDEIEQIVRSAAGVVSGECHLGGIDTWAREIANELNVPFWGFPPLRHSWTFYRKRNLEIVDASDIIYCITVDKLPPDFKSMHFNTCYHCNARDHVKSGGCWTMKQAIKQGKQGKLIVVRN